MKRHRFFVDRGGTFTDVIGLDTVSGEHQVLKLLSSDEAPLLGIRKMLGLGPDAPIPPCELRLGTTLATNALLERKGVRCALLITRGFGDLLEIGTQARPEIFALNIEKPQVLYSSVLEVDARCDPTGNVLQRPDPAQTRHALASLRAEGIQSVAIVVVHAYANPELELELGSWAKQAGFEHVSLSHEVAAEVGLLRRADSTVLDAYLTPLLRGYFERLQAQLPNSELWVMQSGASLCAPAALRGAGSLLSGPAAGVLGCAEVARSAGVPSAIGFDMGGTSTDVCRVTHGRLSHSYETTLASVRVLTPLVDVHTVAAGGGSLCTFDGHALRVGPESAGAFPGPACYGNTPHQGLTITDVNLLLGRLQPDRFPFPLQRARAEAALESLLGEVNAHGANLDAQALLTGLLQLCNDDMVRAIEQVSVRRGFDVRQDALVVYGGAAGQHACAVARSLGIRTVLVPPLAGVLSAFGISLAQLAEHGSRPLSARLDAPGVALARQVAGDLADELRARLDRYARLGDTTHLTVHLELRYQGTDAALSVELAEPAEAKARFESEHERLFGYRRPGHSIEVVGVRVLLEQQRADGRDLANPRSPDAMHALDADGCCPVQVPKPLRLARIHTGERFEEVAVYERETLPVGLRLQGPSCVLDATGTLLLDADFALHVEPNGLLRIQFLPDVALQQPSGRQPATSPAGPDPVSLHLFGRAFMNIAEQMGAVLQRTALSTNIRERLDFSCAVFDAEARLIANAPHIPVHLGAMSESVAAIARKFPEPAPGDVFVTNDPAQGGSHLPDVTVVTPVFQLGQLCFFVASRGHHADIGGITPGSMPPFSSCLAEEGIVLSGLRFVSGGRFERELLLEALSSGPYPARTPLQNLADLQAQVAANQLGARLLGQLLERHGAATVTRYVQHLYDYAASAVQAWRARVGPGVRRFEDFLDDGTRLGVEIDVSDERVHVRFEAPAAQDGNANAPRAVVVSALLYVLRCLTGRDAPLNAGCLRDLQITIPAGSLLDPGPERAVSSGNVETSQRVVDLLFGALGALAGSQGTMNNVSFGNSDFAYYETLGGGAGAGPDFDGASAVQVHMTNTRITDVEVLEQRYPVRVERFCVRRDSGGAGRQRGGDGLVRELSFLAPVEISLVCERRATTPFGLNGAAPGLAGKNFIDGELVPGRCHVQGRVGTLLRIETPGGGGFGT